MTSSHIRPTAASGGESWMMVTELNALVMIVVRRLIPTRHGMWLPVVAVVAMVVMLYAVALTLWVQLVGATMMNLMFAFDYCHICLMWLQQVLI